MTIDTRDDSQKDPETLEREINQTRSNMSQTLDALERKLSPGQLLDQCVNAFGKNGAELAQNFGNSVKQNPVPVALTAIGIMWMIFSSGRSQSVRTYDRRNDDLSDLDTGYTSGRGTGYSSESATGYSSDRDTSYTSQAMDKLKGTADTIKAKATAARGKLMGSKDTMMDTVSDASSRAAVAAEDQVRRARQGFNTLLEEQPLVLGALGIALGAAIGALLPATEHEDRLLGEVRDQTVSKVQEMTSDTYDQVRDKVRQVGETGKADGGDSNSNPPPQF